MKDGYVEPATLAKIFNFDGVRRIDQLVQDGVISAMLVKVNGRSVRRYDLIPTVTAYIKHLQTKLTAKATNLADGLEDELRKTKAEADLKEAKAAIEKMKLAEFEGQMHRSDFVEAVMTDWASVVRDALLSLPGRLAIDTARIKTPEEESIRIHEEVKIILDDLAGYGYDPEKFQKLVRSRKGADEDAAEEKETGD